MAGKFLLQSIGDDLGMFGELLDWHVHWGTCKETASDRVV